MPELTMDEIKKKLFEDLDFLNVEHSCCLGDNDLAKMKEEILTFARAVALAALPPNDPTKYDHDVAVENSILDQIRENVMELTK